MKILYGVQGTGNGHISRSRAMAEELAKRNVDVTYLLSGRDKEKYFDMEVFGDFVCKTGLTFETEKGTVRYLKTLTNSHPIELIQDIRSLDVTQYDLVITDFEPISAWAANKANVPCLGIGHQFAFEHDIPIAGENIMARSVMRHFSPVNYSLGLHWHHFDQPILPPIIAEEPLPESITTDQYLILVYLPFEDASEVIRLLKNIPDYRFALFTNDHEPGEFQNIQVNQLSRTEFQKTLAASNGVICNAGFELASEALHLGKKILVKPLAKQMEQLSNAAALEQLGIGSTMTRLDQQAIEQWLKNAQNIKIDYPNVAAAIADWLLKGDFDNRQLLCDQLWQQTHSQQKPALFRKAADKMLPRSQYGQHFSLTI